MNKMSYKLPLVLLICLCLSSCGMFNSVKDLSPKQQSIVWMSLYNSQYEDAKLVLMNPNATPGQREMAIKKVDILDELNEALSDYDLIANSQGTPSQQLIQVINYLIYKLTDLIVAGGL